VSQSTPTSSDEAKDKDGKQVRASLRAAVRLLAILAAEDWLKAADAATGSITVTRSDGESR